MVCNARLETEILSFKEECAQLRKALREAKVTLAAQEELQAKVEKQKQQILIDSEVCISFKISIICTLYI